MRRPIERGYLVNMDLQAEIWSSALRTLLRVKAPDCGLLLTEPLLNLPNIQDSTDQVSARRDAWMDAAHLMPTLPHNHPKC